MKKQWLSLSILILTFIFLLGPFLILFISAFGSESTIIFPPKKFSIFWFQKVLNMHMFQNAFKTSVFLATASTFVALIIGVPAAYASNRFSYWGKETLNLFFTSPIIVPGLIIGFSLLRFFVLFGNFSIFLGLFIGHTIILLPYIIRVVSASLSNFDTSIEEAAVSLGASRLKTFFLVVLPNVRSGVTAAFILAFITSLNDVPVSLFLSGPGVAPLPIQMLTYMEYYFDPTITALSTILIVFTIFIVQVAEKTLGLSGFLSGRRNEIS